MSSKSKSAVLIASIVILCFVGFAVGVMLSLRRSAVDSPTVVRIPSNADYATLIDSLRSGGIGKMWQIERYGRLKKLDANIRGGYYRFEAGATPRAIVGRLRSGAQTPVRITFNNVRSLEELAERLSNRIEADSATLATYLKEPATAERYGFTPETFIGMFIPDTYEVWWTATPKSLVERLNAEYNRFWEADGRTERLAEMGMTANEVMTLASIVYEETKQTDEMARVAGVYINRLKRGIPLQADPTVKFALGDPSLRRVLTVHTKIDSPYNTYRHRGLPPAPIAMPSKAAIDATLNYQHHNYIYFCAREDFSGYHNFASTLREHNRNARRYARALNERNIK